MVEAGAEEGDVGVKQTEAEKETGEAEVAAAAAEGEAEAAAAAAKVPYVALPVAQPAQKAMKRPIWVA